MQNPKKVHKVNLLDLPQKERLRLCKEIRCILRQRVSEEKRD